jgi:hypothetical protein
VKIKILHRSGEFLFGIGLKPGGKVPRKKERMETLSSKDERG